MRKRITAALVLMAFIFIQSKSVMAKSIFGDKIPAFDTAKRIVAVALAETGYKEGTDNDSKYGRWNGKNHIAWCGSFVSWCAHEAGVPTTSIKPYSDNCMAELSWFKSQKRAQGRNYSPKPGDIIFLDTTYKYEHTGLVVKCEKGIVYTVEGNTGDMVKEKQYPLGDRRIIGYGIPEYEAPKSYATDRLIGNQTVTLDYTSTTLKAGAEQVLEASLSPETKMSDLVWTSTDPKICTVDSAGRILGKGAGTARITVMITNGKTAECKVTVKKAGKEQEPES